MGIDLTLVTFTDYGWGTSAEAMLSLARDYGLWSAVEAVAKAHGVKVPPRFSCYLATDDDGNTVYGVVTEDAYGSPLLYVTAAQLLTIRDHPSTTVRPRRPQDVGWVPPGPEWDKMRELALAEAGPDPLNVAAWAYLAALPPETKVALYWH